MKKTLIKLTSLALLSSGLTAFAAPLTSTIALTPSSSQISPIQSVTVSMDPLVPNANYDISCGLNSTQDGVVVGVRLVFGPNPAPGSGGSTGQLYVNGKPASNSGINQGQLANGATTVFTLKGAMTNGKGNSLSFQNLDQTNSAMIGSCTAVPSTQH